MGLADIVEIGGGLMVWGKEFKTKHRCPSCDTELYYGKPMDINTKTQLSYNELKMHKGDRLVCKKCAWYSTNDIDGILAIDSNGDYIKQGDMVMLTFKTFWVRKQLKCVVYRNKLQYIAFGDTIMSRRLTANKVVRDGRLVKLVDTNGLITKSNGLMDKLRWANGEHRGNV